MPRKKKKTIFRRPVSTCQLGGLHAFGPGFLHAPNRQLEFKGTDDRRLRVHLRELKLVCLYGPVRLTAGAVTLITGAGAGLAYLSMNGSRTNGILHPSNDVWRGRRYRQYRASQDPGWSFHQAKRLVQEKIRSQGEAVRYYQQQGKSPSSASQLMGDASGLLVRARDAENYDQLRGIEGYASRLWFEFLRELLPSPWTFPGRRKHPPTDPVNALLSLGYMTLFHRVEAACQSWGSGVALGCFHEYRPGRASLACDLVEPFRVPLVDRTLISCLARNQFSPDDFQQDSETLAVSCTEEAWKRWLTALETRLHEPGEERSPLHLQIADRVREHAESLPPWDGTYPSIVPPADPLEIFDDPDEAA